MRVNKIDTPLRNLYPAQWGIYRNSFYPRTIPQWNDLDKESAEATTIACISPPSQFVDVIRHIGVCRLCSRSRSVVKLKPGPHQQQCRSNIVECYNVECCFDIVAVFGNNVEETFDRLCCQKRQHCCFDNVASTLLLVWTGLKKKYRGTTPRRRKS